MNEHEMDSCDLPLVGYSGLKLSLPAIETGFVQYRDSVENLLIDHGANVNALVVAHLWM
ncbi:MAG: hypothetical protein ABJA67_06650 [Chthonomonadales bacterium]